MSTGFEIDGVGPSVQIGKGGSRIKENGGAVDFRDNADSAYVSVRGANAVGPNDFVTNQQFQGAIAGIDWKENARAATTGIVDLAGGSFVNDGSLTDGVILADGDRVLVRAQNAVVPSDIANGIYVFDSGTSTFARSSDLDVGSSAVGAVVVVTEGVTLADTIFRQVNEPAVVGTDALNWEVLPVGGITSIVSAGGTVSIIDSGAAPTASLKGLSDTPTVAFTDGGTSITADVIDGSISTAKIADAAVTESKLADGVVLTRQVAFTDTEVNAGSVNIGAVLPAGTWLVIRQQVLVSTVFRAVASPVEMVIGDGVQTLMPATDIDLETDDTYFNDRVAEIVSAGATQLSATFTNSALDGVGRVVIQLVKIA